MKIRLTKISLWAKLGDIGSKRSQMLFSHVNVTRNSQQQRFTRLRGGGSACGGRKSQSDGSVTLASWWDESSLCLAGSTAACAGFNDSGRNGESAGEGGKRSIYSALGCAGFRKAAIFFGFTMPDGQTGAASPSGARVLSTGALRGGGVSGERDAGGSMESITVGGPTGQGTIHPD